MILAYMRVADLISEIAPCFVGDPPDNIPTPYCFVWGPIPVESPRTLAASLETLALPFHVQVVAKQAPDALLLADAVKEALRRAEVQVSGWRVFPLKVTGSEPVQTVRSVANQSSNTYPAWVTLHVLLTAAKEVGRGITG